MATQCGCVAGGQGHVVVQAGLHGALLDAELLAEVYVELTASPDNETRTIVGFYPFDTSQVELPFELSIDTDQIGGPSAVMLLCSLIAQDSAA